MAILEEAQRCPACAYGTVVVRVYKARTGRRVHLATAQCTNAAYPSTRRRRARQRPVANTADIKDARL
jgi:hypothetical protein